MNPTKYSNKKCNDWFDESPSRPWGLYLWSAGVLILGLALMAAVHYSVPLPVFVPLLAGTVLLVLSQVLA